MSAKRKHQKNRIKAWRFSNLKDAMREGFKAGRSDDHIQQLRRADRLLRKHSKEIKNGTND